MADDATPACETCGGSRFVRDVDLMRGEFSIPCPTCSHPGFSEPRHATGTSWVIVPEPDGPREQLTPQWVQDCPPGERRELTETVGDATVTQRIDRRPLTGMDLAASMVGMDKAEFGGLLTWPDIVGKPIGVHWLSGDVLSMGEPNDRKVLSVGPLGALVEWAEPAMYGATGWAEVREGTRSDRQKFRALIPWGAAVISWEAE